MRVRRNVSRQSHGSEFRLRRGGQNLPTSGILPTWTGYGKTVRTCLNMVQTCMYMCMQVHGFMNVYVHGMYMYMI